MLFVVLPRSLFCNIRRIPGKAADRPSDGLPEVYGKTNGFKVPLMLEE